MKKVLDFLFEIQDENKDKYEKIISTFVYNSLNDDPVSDYAIAYEKNANEYNKLFQQIIQNLPKEKYDLLYELDFCIGFSKSITEKVRYLQGFKDAFKLLTIFNSL